MLEIGIYEKDGKPYLGVETAREEAEWHLKRLRALQNTLPRDSRLFVALEVVVDRAEGHKRMAEVAWSRGDRFNAWDHYLLSMGFSDAGIMTARETGENPGPAGVSLDYWLDMITALLDRVKELEFKVLGTWSRLPGGHPLGSLRLDSVVLAQQFAESMLRSRELVAAYAHLQYGNAYVTGIEEILARYGTMVPGEPLEARKMAKGQAKVHIIVEEGESAMAIPEPEVPPIFSPDEMQDLHNRAHASQQAFLEQLAVFPPDHYVRHQIAESAPLADHTLEIGDQSFFETLDWKWACYSYIFSESIYKSLIELFKATIDYDHEQAQRAAAARPAPAGFPGIPAPMGGPGPMPAPRGLPAPGSMPGAPPTIPAEFEVGPMESRRAIGMEAGPPPSEEKKKRWWFFNPETNPVRPARRRKPAKRKKRKSSRR